MINQDQIKQWLEEGTITQEQAQKMLIDSATYKKEKSSNNFIVAISTIGSILLGIGAILFVASNWNILPDFIKVILLVGITFIAYFFGYVFQYQKQNFPKVGASLILLGALLFGASVFLIAQIYNIKANSHILILIWILGILPLVYAFESKLVIALSSILFFIWIAAFIFSGKDFWNIEKDLIKLPVLYLVSGVLFFGIGAIHYLNEQYKEIGRYCRLAGLKVAMISLFFLTFNFFSKTYSYGIYQVAREVRSEKFTLWFGIFVILAIAFSLVNLFVNPTNSKTNKLENLLSLGLISFAFIFFLFPSTSSIYVLLFNLILAGLIILIIYLGYSKSDISLVNLGFFWLGIFLFVKYFDFFWGLLDRSLFFMIGGSILVFGGIMLEKKRRKLKTEFINQIQFTN